MKLTIEQIRTITTGAVRIIEEPDGIHFCRFTAEQEEMYRLRRQDFYEYTFSTPGIRLRFRTDSNRLALNFLTENAGPRTFFSVDISVNGEFFDCVDNCRKIAPAEMYGSVDYPLGRFSGSWELPEGEKEICIYLPWSVKFVLQELQLQDGASLIPVQPAKKALCFGDSITHGADAIHPCRRYISRLCDYLGVQEYSKAICGEMFWPELAAAKDDFLPEYIAVAYGTNDWSHDEFPEVEAHCRGFFNNLIRTYPEAKIIAITPLWRKDEKEKSRKVPLCAVHELICDAVKDYPNATVICGDDLVPHDPAYFGDLRLHPNDKGFDCYYENLVKALSR